MTHDEDEKDYGEPSAKDQLEGRLGEIDKLVMMLAMMKTLMAPSPSPNPAAGPPSPLPGSGMGPMPMGSPLPPMGPPPMGGPAMGMAGPMGPMVGGPMPPPGALQQALAAAKGLV